MSVESRVLWMDGSWVPFADAKVHVLSHTLHYGLGAFEGLRAYTQPDGRAGVWRLRDHMRRFVDSMRMMQMKCAYTVDELCEACLATLRENELTAAYIRPLAFLGMGEMGLGARSNKVHVAIAVWQWGSYLGDDGMKRGVRLMTSSYTRHHPNAALQRAKVVGHYVNSILARYEANDNGFDEALMLDQSGFVAEGTGENVFLARDGIVHTSPVTNILPGITRATVLEILAHEGIEAREGFFGRDALYTADEAFMCGSAAEVTPIRELDRRAIGTATPGPITSKVQEIYLSAVRGNVDWLQHHIAVE